MKAKYLKPTAKDILLSIDDLMLTISGNGETIVDDGGTTSGSGITQGDSRRHYRAWEEEDLEEEEW